MKKLFVFAVLVMLLAAGPCISADGEGGRGPAPNSGDGVSDGSGFDSPNGPNGPATGSGNGPAGPAPNSGDGVPDGSGFDSKNGPNGTGSMDSGNRPGSAGNSDLSAGRGVQAR